MLTFELIKEAAARIDGRVHRTPVMTSQSFNQIAGCEVFFKCENLQRAGAFKARGATNKILSLTEAEKERGVIAVSSGNHAQAVALAAREAGTRAVVCIPDDAPQMKVAGMRSYGADIRVFDRHKDDRDAFGRDIAERENLVMIPAYDDYLIMAGQGTSGLELLEEVPELDAVTTPCSGGGLFAGVSTAVRSMKPSIKCFAVEPESANDTQQSLAQGERVKISPPPTIADGLRVQTPGALTFPITRANADAVLTVSDDEILATMRFMLFHMKLLIEPSGACAAAAVLHRKFPSECRRIGVVLSGGNVDPDVLSRVITHGDK
jgi:threo-3-hydroxy-L-aspartate ammonia-lyase